MPEGADPLLWELDHWGPNRRKHKSHKGQSQGSITSLWGRKADPKSDAQGGGPAGPRAGTGGAPSRCRDRRRRGEERELCLKCTVCLPVLRVQFESRMDVLARVHPHDILDVALGALVVLKEQLPSRPDMTKAFGRALLAVDALRRVVSRRVRTARELDCETTGKGRKSNSQGGRASGLERRGV